MGRLACEAGQHRTLVLVLAYTGIRWGEVVALDDEPFDPTEFAEDDDDEF